MNLSCSTICTHFSPVCTCIGLQTTDMTFLMWWEILTLPLRFKLLFFCQQLNPFFSLSTFFVSLYVFLSLPLSLCRILSSTTSIYRMLFSWRALHSMLLLLNCTCCWDSTESTTSGTCVKSWEKEKDFTPWVDVSLLKPLPWCVCVCNDENKKHYGHRIQIPYFNKI